jgi:hypothetical protein
MEAAGRRQKQRRAFWTKQLHQWHWISSALSLVGMLLFAVTGITLNNAARIEAAPVVTRVEAVLPEALLTTLDVEQSLSPGVRDWFAAELGVRVDAGKAEWSDDELYVSLPRPGGDAWFSIDRDSGAVEYERTDRGVIAYLNDLHKGRHTGLAWSWFIDLFSAACVVFCLTGLFLLYLHGRHRPATWPVVGAGFVIPLLLALLLIH